MSYIIITLSPYNKKEHVKNKKNNKNATSAPDVIVSKDMGEEKKNWKRKKENIDKHINKCLTTKYYWYRKLIAVKWERDDWVGLVDGRDRFWSGSMVGAERGPERSSKGRHTT